MKILMGIDDSPSSLAAMRFVKQMPWSRDAWWDLVSAVQAPTMAYALPDMTGTAEAMIAMKEQARHQQDLLDGLERELRADGYHPHVLVAEGDPRALLLQAAENARADLLVVGSHGRTGVTRVLLGSVASHVAVHAHRSVLVVKKASRPIGTGTRPMTILIGVDDSECSRDAVAFVRSLKWPEGTRIHLLSALPSTQVTTLVSNGMPPRLQLDAARLQQEFVSRVEREFRDDGFATEAVVLEGDPRIELERVARELDADLTVVGSHRRKGWQKLVLGSVAAHILSHASCNVLVVHREAAA